jgi:pimeloyl-ACP methyl ester carboxylesterase
VKWLLLRGLTREQRHWGSFHRQFCNAFGKDQVYCLDHVGVGTEGARPPVYSVRGMTLDLRRRWLDLKQDQSEPWGIVSLSLGSMVSLDWCASFNGDFSKQVIINVSSATDSKPWDRLVLKNLRTFSQMAKISDPKERELKVLDMCTNLLTRDQKDHLANEWSLFSMPKSQTLKVLGAQMLAATRFHRPSKMKVPTLGLVSAADRLVDPTCTLKISQALGIPLEIHPTGGHELTLDDPDWVVQKIKDFAL